MNDDDEMGMCEHCGTDTAAVTHIIDQQAARIAELERDAALYSALYDAAKGLSFGTDWNKGTHAGLHGYRRKLLDAVAALDAALLNEGGKHER